jgi:protein ImuA
MLADLRNKIAPADPLTLAPRRMHEAGGRGRRGFAMFQAMRHPGPVVWIAPDHIPERPMLTGLPQGLGERLILLTPKGETDLLWSVEEALRAAPVALVIAEPQEALSLTEGRRLQLAAEAGGTTGIMLIREGDGVNSTESRWNCEPVTGKADSTLHQWSLSKNKKGTLGSWLVNWNGASAAFHLVSEAGKRREPSETPG